MHELAGDPARVPAAACRPACSTSRPPPTLLGDACAGDSSAAASSFSFSIAHARHLQKTRPAPASRVCRRCLRHTRERTASFPVPSRQLHGESLAGVLRTGVFLATSERMLDSPPSSRLAVKATSPRPAARARMAVGCRVMLRFNTGQLLSVSGCRHSAKQPGPGSAEEPPLSREPKSSGILISPRGRRQRYQDARRSPFSARLPAR
jgi:hypothetical protein